MKELIDISPDEGRAWVSPGAIDALILTSAGDTLVLLSSGQTFTYPGYSPNEVLDRIIEVQSRSEHDA